MSCNGYSLGLACLFLSFISLGLATERFAMVDSSQENPHENHPRIFSGFFSTPKHDTAKHHGLGLKEHFGNIMKGGSFGFQAEFKPFAPLHDLLDHAKSKFHNKPHKALFEKPKIPKDQKEPDTHEDKKVEEKPKPKPEYDGYEDWEHQFSKDPVTGGPHWEDIGEGSYYGYTPKAIEDIIQPRKRSKRRVESHVFHVPVEFVSNGRPYLVEIKTKNGV